MLQRASVIWTSSAGHIDWSMITVAEFEIVALLFEFDSIEWIWNLFNDFEISFQKITRSSAK